MSICKMKKATVHTQKHHAQFTHGVCSWSFGIMNSPNLHHKIMYETDEEKYHNGGHFGFLNGKLTKYNNGTSFSLVIF